MQRERLSRKKPFRWERIFHELSGAPRRLCSDDLLSGNVSHSLRHGGCTDLLRTSLTTSWGSWRMPTSPCWARGWPRSTTSLTSSSTPPSTSAKATSAFLRPPLLAPVLLAPVRRLRQVEALLCPLPRRRLRLPPAAALSAEDVKRLVLQLLLCPPLRREAQGCPARPCRLPPRSHGRTSARAAGCQPGRAS